MLLTLLASLSLLLTGAIFGFFYAWICSTMWGLDTLDPRLAIEAMNAMNRSVRNIVFAPAFFATPLVLLVTALVAYATRHYQCVFWFAAAGLVYFAGAMVPTAAVNVPMNEQLAQIDIPQSRQAAQVIWSNYSSPWQFWNTTRTVFSGIALLLCGNAIRLLRAK